MFANILNVFIDSFLFQKLKRNSNACREGVATCHYSDFAGAPGNDHNFDRAWTMERGLPDVVNGKQLAARRVDLWNR